MKTIDVNSEKEFQIAERLISRKIMGYKSNSDYYEIKFELQNVSLKDLQEQFGIDKKDPYYIYGYNIKPKHTTWVEKCSGQKLDFKRYNYQMSPHQKRTEEIDKIMHRKIVEVDKKSDYIISAFELENTSTAELRNLFTEKRTDFGLVETYKITAKYASWFQNKFGLKLNLRKYNYFLYSEFKD